MPILLFSLSVVFAIAPSSALAQKRKTNTLRVDSCNAAQPEGRTANQRATEKARDLYDKGLVLYEQGDYQGAVDAFVGSYCSKAHYASYYNIAQSYERLLDFERAVLYFKRYAKEASPGDPDIKKALLRAEVLRNLPAQVRIATVPPGAAITIRNAAGITARGTANRDRALEVVQGNYTMTIEMPGYDTIEQALRTRPGLPYAYTFSLRPKTSLVQITTNPKDARIFLDDRLVGVGSYSDKLDLGTYLLTVEAPGRPTYSETIQSVEDQPTELSIALETPSEGGRNTLLVAAPIAMVLMSGATMSQAFGVDTSLTAIGSLATTGLTFVGAYYGIPEATTRGDAWYIIEAGLFGAAEATLVGSFFSCNRKTLNNCNQKVVTGTTLIGGLAGMTLSALTYQDWQLSSGDTALLATGGFWGASMGALFYAAFDSEREVLLPLLFAGLNVGVATSAGLISTTQVSLRRVAIINLAGIGGVLGGSSLAATLQSSGEQNQHLTLLGAIAGLTAGTFLTRYMDESSAKRPRGTKTAWLPAIGNGNDAQGNSILSLGLQTTF